MANDCFLLKVDCFSLRQASMNTFNRYWYPGGLPPPGPPQADKKGTPWPQESGVHIHKHTDMTVMQCDAKPSNTKLRNPKSTKPNQNKKQNPNFGLDISSRGMTGCSNTHARSFFVRLDLTCCVMIKFPEQTRNSRFMGLCFRRSRGRGLSWSPVMLGSTLQGHNWLTCVRSPRLITCYVDQYFAIPK